MAPAIKAKVHQLPGVEHLYSAITKDQLEIPAYITEYDMAVSTNRSVCGPDLSSYRPAFTPLPFAQTNGLHYFQPITQTASSSTTPDYWTNQTFCAISESSARTRKNTDSRVRRFSHVIGSLRFLLCRCFFVVVGCYKMGDISLLYRWYMGSHKFSFVIEIEHIIHNNTNITNTLVDLMHIFRKQQAPPLCSLYVWQDSQH